jgi:hypothetical protein
MNESVLPILFSQIKMLQFAITFTVPIKGWGSDGWFTQLKLTLQLKMTGGLT